MIRHLRNYNARWGEGPGDALILDAEVTLVAGAANINVKGLITEGAPVFARIFKEVKVTDGVITVNDTIGATDTVRAIVIYDAKDIAVAGENPVE